MKKIILLLLALLFISKIPAEDFRILTDPLPPFNFLEDDTPQGISVELIKAILKAEGYKADNEIIEFIPWARAHQIVETTPYTILMTAARTPTREDLFYWVGPISSMNIGIIVPNQKRLKIDTIDDLNNSQYYGSVINNSAPFQIISGKGFPLKRLELMENPYKALEMMTSGRTDFFVHSDISTVYIMKQTGVQFDQYEMELVLMSLDLYFAVSKSSGIKTADSLQRRFIEFNSRENGSESLLDSLKKKYLGEEPLKISRTE